MSPSLALLTWVVLVIVLLRFDPSREPSVSFALWIPITWMFIVGSRLPSQWFGGGQMGQFAEALEEGNPIDRAVYLALIALAIGVLLRRSFGWSEFVRHNRALALFVVFGLVSVCWSDFPFVAAKRWARDLGNYLSVLVVLTDPEPLNAICTVLRRLCYLLAPLSVILIKYFPDMGRQYSIWNGEVMYIGVTTGKDLLGVVCLISGIFFFWDTLNRWGQRRSRRTKYVIGINLAMLVMTMWLLGLASCATCRVCLLLGCLVIAAGRLKVLQSRPRFLKFMVPASFVLYLVLAFGLGMNGDMAQAVGRDPTLTDRTKIWSMLLKMDTNGIGGSGYESCLAGISFGRDMAWRVRKAQRGTQRLLRNLSKSWRHRAVLRPGLYSWSLSNGLS